MNKEAQKQWIRDTALIFYQIFSVDYENEDFSQKLLKGGGGNSTLCSTWTQLSDCFIKYRISEKAYDGILQKINATDRKLIVKNDNHVTIPYDFIYKKYHKLFFNNAKGAENRKKNGKYFHFDHNPSNKKVLLELKKEITNNKRNEEVFLKKLANYIKQIQTVDLITVEEDDIRTKADLNQKKDKLNSTERDKISKSSFYDLNIVR